MLQVINPVANPRVHPSTAGSTQMREKEDVGGGIKVIYDDFFLKHRPPPGHPHPECPARVATAKTELDRLEVGTVSNVDESRPCHNKFRLFVDRCAKLEHFVRSAPFFKEAPARRYF